MADTVRCNHKARKSNSKVWQGFGSSGITSMCEGSSRAFPAAMFCVEWGGIVTRCCSGAVRG